MDLDFGAKATNLESLRTDFGFKVPDFLAIPFNELFDDFETQANAICSEIDLYLSAEQTLEKTKKSIQKHLQRLQLDQDKVHETYSLAQVKGWKKVSFRTSAALEDGTEHSFAGQYESFLDVEVTRESIEVHVRKTFESMLSERVLLYLKARGISQFKLGGSVVVQEMFFGKVSGVLFTENGSGKILISYVDSWRNSVVEGEDAKELLVDRTELAKTKLPSKFLELCQKSLEIEFAVGCPVDVEFAFDESQLMFLQYRPITNRQLESTFEWDSTNISENYPGITLPLTYSLIRKFYAGVYLAFFGMLGASEKEIKAKAHIAENMLGYLNGRVFYRITNWYEAVALMPGRFNQEFFEGMLNPVKRRGKSKRARMDLKSLITLIRFMALLAGSERASIRFSKRIAERIALYDAIDFSFINAAAILDASKKAREEILRDWSITILNDVRLMVFHGILQKLYEKNENPNDYLNLIQGLSDRASIKPLEALSELGKTIEQALAEENTHSLEKLTNSRSWPKVKRAVGAYITAFGARTPGELKLENVRITDEIENVLELALKAARSGISTANKASETPRIWPKKSNALSRMITSWVASQTRSAIDWRERFRFNRAQTFNLSRKAFDSIGAALAAEDILEDPRDIYWLTDQEVDELVNAHAPVLSGKKQVEDRKKQFALYEKQELGLAVSGSGRIAANHLSKTENVEGDGRLSGNGVAPGLVTCEAIVVLEFDPKLDVRGKVLVVRYIDPGWTLLFTQAAAIIAERGNALSHAAIISREIGIPAIVGAVNATSQIQTGQVITVNGNTGGIRIESA